MEKVTHKLSRTDRTGYQNVYTLFAVCGYFETFDLTYQKKYDTGFLQTGDYTCEECKKVEGLRLLRRL